MRFVIVAFLSLLASLPAFGGPFTNIYFFGDSVTDTGNVTEVYATLPHPPGAPATVPGSPYDPEGRASNGPLYADVLAAGLGFNATASERGGNNYAFGGARTRYQIFGPAFNGIIAQVDEFRSQPGPADPKALYVVFGGANNLQDILVGRTTDVFGNPIPGVGGTISDIASILTSLYLEGARNFLVPNAPNLGLVPRVIELGASVPATGLTLAFNGALSNALTQFDLLHPDAETFLFDTFATLNSIVASPGAFGITDTTHRCYTGDDLTFTGGGTVCSDPDSFLFWDGIHPTAKVHNILGNAMLAAVAPEPGTLGILGIALVGLAWTRRRG